jgi:hypothetical protein
LVLLADTGRSSESPLVPEARLVGNWQSVRVGIPFRELDIDSNKRLSSEEVQNTRLTARFKELDVDQDKVLNPEEYLHFWKTDPSGIITLRLRADRSALLKIPPQRQPPQEELVIEPLIGAFKVQGGLWVLKVADIENRETTYGIVSHGINSLSLVDAKGDAITFQRAR